MKKMIHSVVVASALFFAVNSAQAGVGLSVVALANLADGAVLAAAIGGGLGAGSIANGIRLINNGRIGWGVFFLILKENSLINAQDAEVLSQLDVATQEAIVEISTGADSSEVKAERLNALLNN